MVEATLYCFFFWYVKFKWWLRASLEHVTTNGIKLRFIKFLAFCNFEPKVCQTPSDSDARIEVVRNEWDYATYETL